MHTQATTTVRTGSLPRLHWSAIAAGVFVALATHVVLGLIGSSLGSSADAFDSKGIGGLAGFWALLTPFLATLAGAAVAVRISHVVMPRAAHLHGVLAWCIGLIAGAIFLGGVLSNGAAAAGRGAPQRGSEVSATSRDGAGRNGGDELKREAKYDASQGMALAAIAALVGLGGAFLGSAIGRREVQGRPVFDAAEWHFNRGQFHWPQFGKGLFAGRRRDPRVRRDDDVEYRH